MSYQDALTSKKHLPYGGARAIYDSEIISFIENISQKNSIKNILQNDVTSEFLTNYFLWLQKSKCNNLHGLDKFNHLSFSNGTTETFDKFYIKNSKKRLRVFKGEYMYHYATHRNGNHSFAWIEDEPLDKNDYIIISLPFADSGFVHENINNILDTASELKIPVLIDCAYLGTCYGINFDFSHDAIEIITVSLSKSFSTAYFRIGMRMSKYDYDDGLDIYRKTCYDNRYAALIGNSLINNFSIDFIPNKYKNIQTTKCKEINCTPSKTVLFGLGDEKFFEYNRGGNYNRLFLGGLYAKL